MFSQRSSFESDGQYRAVYTQLYIHKSTHEQFLPCVLFTLCSNQATSAGPGGGKASKLNQEKKHQRAPPVGDPVSVSSGQMARRKRLCFYHHRRHIRPNNGEFVVKTVSVFFVLSAFMHLCAFLHCRPMVCNVFFFIHRSDSFGHTRSWGPEAPARGVLELQS